MVDTRFSVSVQIMMTLAAHSEELVNSEFLAKVLKTNATFVRKLVSNLVNAGLITSYRGKGGGVKISRLPYEITLKEIYLASTEKKPLIKVHKKPVSKTCSVSRCIDGVMCELAQGIDQSTQSFLAKRSLGDLMQNV